MRAVAENTPAGQGIGPPVTAADGDGDTLTYSLGGADAASFGIAASSGQLQTGESLDCDTKDSYSVTVPLHDGKNAQGGADTTIDDTIGNNQPSRKPRRSIGACTPAWL